MRVIAGSARSVPLYEVREPTTRPMTDRVKTSLFSILTQHIPGAHVLDLFAGTGSLGIEALSRGALSCTFVEHDRACIVALERNLERTRLADRARVMRADCWRAARRLAAQNLCADLAFLDPPFRIGKGRERKRLDELAETIAGGALRPNGLLVYHHESDTPGDLDVIGLVATDRRLYGRNVVTMFRTSAKESAPLNAGE